MARHTEAMCERGNHDYGQAGRCSVCGSDRGSDSRGWGDRRSGGAGSLTHPLTNGEYKRQLDKLAR